MRGRRWAASILFLETCAWIALPVRAQQTSQSAPQQATESSAAKPQELPAGLPTIEPRNPPPPPADETSAPAATPPRVLPSKVSLAGGTRIDVVLETPLSTRIAKKGQEVIFRATQPIPLGDGLELPDQTAFVGAVAEVKKPGAFGGQGVLRVAMKRVDLPSGASADIVARLDSPDMKGQGRISSDSNGKSKLANLVFWTLAGTFIGGRAAGGKGAGYGAAAGGAIWLISMLAHRGSDVYLEPGMPFTVLLDEPVELPGSVATFSSDSGSGSADQPASPPDDMPRLQHRPKPSP